MKTKFLSLLLVLVASSLLGFASVSEDQFRFISNQDGSSVGLAQIASHQTLEYSLDGVSWGNMTTATTFSLSKDVVLYVRGKLTDNNSDTDFTQFTITGAIEARGNINYIWDYENLNAPLKERCGWSLFKNCTGLCEVAHATLPSMTLAYACYQDLLFGCTNIKKSPELPAMVMEKECYRGMFVDCASLTDAPCLPALKLAEQCYMDMFVRCYNLEYAPSLPADTLLPYCYNGMFVECTNLLEAPKLPALALADHCYASMFAGCTNLASAPALPATTLAPWCYYCMFFGCKRITASPQLPAAILTEGCYYKMFKQCSNLQKITCLATDISAEQCLVEWVKSISSSGTFIKHQNMSSWPSGNNGIPSGWNINSVNIFTITWLQDDGSLIDKTMVESGQIPTHVAPTKPDTEEYTYTFVKWAPDVVPATENATYIAIYESHKIPTALDNVNADMRATKVLQNGQIFIFRGDKVYTVDGRLTN